MLYKINHILILEILEICKHILVCKWQSTKIRSILSDMIDAPYKNNKTATVILMEFLKCSQKSNRSL